jgi:Tol biopolymer transport system component
MTSHRSTGRRRFARRSLVGLLALGALLALAVPAGAVLSGRNGRIAFTSGRATGDAEAQIYLRPVIGSSGAGTVSQPVGIAGTGVQNRHASWSPDRTKLVFAAGTAGSPTTELYDLFVRDFEANTITPLDGVEATDSLSSDHPAWSPDGTRIAYEHQPTVGSAERDIMVKTFGTSAPAVNLTTGAPVEFKPAWSPDSQTIYYAKTNATLDIVKRPAAGGAEAPVAASGTVDEYQPSISPDGSKICFTLQTTLGGPSNPGGAEIYTAPLSNTASLTNLSLDGTQGDINCTWSPDSRFIAYVSGTFGSGKLVMKNSDGTSLFPVALEDDQGSNNFDGNPDWAPDGSPDCPDSTVTTPPNTPITIQLECTDTGPQYERTDPNGFVANDGGPANGTTSDDAPLANPSTVKYTPNAGFTGTDKIVFTSFDTFGFGTDKGTVTINVRAPAGGGNGTPVKCAGRTATIVGTAKSETLLGTSGRDVIVGQGGNDKIRAGRGNDIVCGGSGRDRIGGGRGNDRIGGDSGNDRVNGEQGNDRVSGGSGNDRVSGGSGNDSVSGGSGRDRLSGDSGRDRLNGGSSRDRCTGGSGHDRASRCEVRSRIP